MVGHSLGGYLSAVYTMLNPAHVSNLILVSPVGIGEPPAALQSQQLPVAYKLLRQLWSMNITPQQAVRLMGTKRGKNLAFQYVDRRYLGFPDEDKQLFADYIYLITVGKGSGEYAMNTILAPGAFARFPLIGQMPSIECPTSFVFGESDWMDYRPAAQVAPAMKDASGPIFIPKSGHNMMLENVTYFNDVLTRLCERV
eukprot:GFYU01039578.1.p1 GENE.GFYU01039578.1~~GFYU01039578.1.p1  ORF type:complete len:228 (-),score=35.69 GFYU01039578.1:321-914(-)